MIQMYGWWFAYPTIQLTWVSAVHDLEHNRNFASGFFVCLVGGLNIFYFPYVSIIYRIILPNG
jgi:hypothetical protein